MSLFRTESEEARSRAWLGKIVLVRPVSFALLTVIALGIAVALAAFFILGEYTRKARVAGIVSPAAGVVRVIAPQSGVVEAIRISEGASVSKDAPMMRLADGRAGGSTHDVGSAIAAQLIERRRALAHQREFTTAAMITEQGSLAHRQSALAKELAQLDTEIFSQAQRAMLAQDGLRRAYRLEGIGFLSAAGLDKERDSALDQESRLEAARRTRLALARDLAAVEFDIASARARANAQLASLDVQRAALDQEGIERGLQYRAEIVAPSSGIVATVLVEPGQTVTSGTPLATIIPSHARLEAHLYAPSRSIGFVRAGQVVLLRYLSYPHQKFGSHKARVLAVSRNPMPPNELGFTPIDGSREPLYRIKVALDEQSITAYGKQEPLQAGMQVEADILLDRRRLIEWIFEPLLSLAGRT
ncbi:MAG: HlyD family secretion protein [Usitatibacter sp.]